MNGFVHFFGLQTLITFTLLTQIVVSKVNCNLRQAVLPNILNSERYSLGKQDSFTANKSLELGASTLALNVDIDLG